jgi:hypothetical protein
LINNKNIIFTVSDMNVKNLFTFSRRLTLETPPPFPLKMRPAKNVLCYIGVLRCYVHSFAEAEVPVEPEVGVDSCIGSPILPMVLHQLFLYYLRHSLLSPCPTNNGYTPCRAFAKPMLSVGGEGF